MGAERRATRWWRSLYWRIGVSFVAFVVAISLAQSLIFSYRVRRDAQDLRTSPNAVAMDVSFALSEQLERGQPIDLAALQRARYPEWTRLYVVTRGGEVHGATATPLAPDVLATARQTIDPTASARQGVVRPSGPVIMAPLRVRGQLHGLVVISPPVHHLHHEILKFFSFPGFLILLGATVLAAVVIFTPARRRLAALEAAAERMGSGDLQARAPESGADEIARVAHAFNRMGDEIAARDDALRGVDERRRQMLADVSHELRTPLTAMRGFIETLQMTEIDADPERRARYFATLSRETRRLERIVADLLDVARLEHGVAEFSPQIFDVRRLFEEVVRRHERAAAAAGIRLAIEVAPAADQVHGDPHRIEQAVENLVANAMRHTGTDGVVVLRAIPAPEGVCLSVRDTGPGIPVESLDHVFDRFYKADPSRAASQEGSGLGLSIVRAIVQRHGGRVGVTSRPGHTEFTITLPQES